MKRFIALALALLMLLSLLSALAATPPCKHNWMISKVIVEPTCTKTGVRREVCTKCGLDREVVLPALGHEFSKQVYTSYADCTHYGIYHWECARCGAHSDTGNDKPLGHDWDEGVVTKEPTQTEEGIKTYTCKRDPSHTMTEMIPATGEATDPEPSLKLEVTDFSATEDYNYISNFLYHDWMYYSVTLYLDLTIENTGNIPLNVKQVQSFGGKNVEWRWTDNYYSDEFYNKDDILTLQPGESYSKHGSYLLNYWPYDESFYVNCISGNLVLNTDSANYYLLLTDSIYYQGYDAEEFPSSGKDYSDYHNTSEPVCLSNTCTIDIKWPMDGMDVTQLGFNKAVTNEPANGKYYELGETIDYVITLTNDSDGDIKDLAVYDSLAGFEPIATAESLAQGETRQFRYSAVVTDEEITKAQAVNSAVVTFTYGDGNSATPRFSNWVYSRAGNTETPETAHFDKAKLDAVPEFSSDAETAEQWNAKAEKLYELLWEAGDDMAKCAVLEERAMFYAYLEAINDGLSPDAVAFRQLMAEALHKRLMGLAGADNIEETASDATGEQVGIELIAEELRLKCMSLSALINELP